MGQWNWLDSHTQRAAANGLISKWRAMASGAPVPQDLVFELVLLYVFAGSLDTEFQCTFNRITLKQKPSLWSSWHSGGKELQKSTLCHPEGCWDAWEAVPCKPCEVLQDQVQSLLSILGQTQVQIQTGQRMHWEKSCQEGLGAMHTDNPESQPCPVHVHQVEGGDFPL